MNKSLIKFSLFAFLFVFGLLFGIEAKKNNVDETEKATETIQATHYISRIENGQFVYEPMHDNREALLEPQSDAKKDLETHEQNDEATHEHSGPKMNKTGKLDRIGQALGAKLSEITRATLEKSISVFID